MMFGGGVSQSYERTPSSAAAKRGLDNFQIVVYFQRSLTEVNNKYKYII